MSADEMDSRMARLEELVARLEAQTRAVRDRAEPAPDGPAVALYNPYRTDSSQVLEARPPAPYRAFNEAFEY